MCSPPQADLQTCACPVAPVIKRLALLALLLLLAAPFVLYIIADRTINDRDAPQVLAAPPGSLAPVAIDPYDGPHPRTVGRPAETFPFPLRPGDVGPDRPLFAGEYRYPFLCRTTDSGLGQPLVDNQDGIGMAVFALDAAGEPTDEIVGYSRDCLLATRVEYWVLAAERDGIEQVEGPVDAQGRPVVRVEIGTINRYIYLIMLPAGTADQPERPDLSRWNRRLIYQFRGGVGIGHRQGHAAVASLLDRRGEALAAGYAVAYSSANQTSNHYNIALAEDTLARVKRQFVTAYAEPLYTVGVGGSGGAIQQYLIGQNRPGLLDAAVALYSYPDMITQSIYVLDCEPLAWYFDENSPDRDFWLDVDRRAAVVGLNASDELAERFGWIARAAELARGRWPRLGSGSTECTRAWRGMTPVVLNPHYAHFATRFAPAVRERVEWTYWADLRHYFGTDANGWARRTWDNVGVQYGLRALTGGEITPPQFLDLNRRVGGWKQPQAMVPARMWLADAARSPLAEFSPWDHPNLTASDAGDAPAPRTRADLEAVRAGWRSGQVFLGLIDIPVIDLRHYLEPELDMHHAVASFSSRLRIQRAMGQADHQLIWMTRPDHAPYAQAFELLDRWLAARRNRPEAAAAEVKPADAVDRCWDGDGNVIAEGPGVWDGGWNGRTPGDCQQAYPHYLTPRMVAGEDYYGDRFTCALQPVKAAIDRGVYGVIDMGPWQAELEAVFPDGVCDYARPDPGLPPEIAEMAGIHQATSAAGPGTGVGRLEREHRGEGAAPATPNPERP